MNTGNALVMSPSLITKYLDAGKAIASHAVLLPDGIRFSTSDDRGAIGRRRSLGEIRGVLCAVHGSGRRGDGHAARYGAG